MVPRASVLDVNKNIRTYAVERLNPCSSVIYHRKQPIKSILSEFKDSNGTDKRG